MKTHHQTAEESPPANSLRSVQLALAARQPDRARRLLERVDPELLNHVDGCLCRAALHSQLGEHAEALSCLMKALDRSDSCAQCLTIQQTIIQLGRAADVDEIIQRSKRHKSSDSERVRQQFQEAHLRWQSGQYERAVHCYEAYSRLIQTTAGSSASQTGEALMALARAQLRIGEFEAAIATLNDLMDRQLGHPWHCHALELKSLTVLGRASDCGPCRDAPITCQPGCPVVARDQARQRILSGQQVSSQLLSDADQIRVDGSVRLLDRYPDASGLRWYGLDTCMLHDLIGMLPNQGIIVECGVYFGRSLRMMSTWSDRLIAGFDSFEGLPESWGNREPAGAYSTEHQQPDYSDQVTMYPGWFRDTLPEFVRSTSPDIALLHLDCDLYSSSMDCVTHLQDCLVDGAIVLFDDLLGYPGYRDHEWRALEEWQAQLKADQCGTLEPISAVIMDRAVAFRWHC